MAAESSDTIRLREYVDLRINDLKEVIAMRERVNEQRIDLAREELARRLDILNHAHQLAVEVQQNYVPRDLFEQRVRTLEKYVWGLAAVISAVVIIVPLILRLREDFYP